MRRVVVAGAGSASWLSAAVSIPDQEDGVAKVRSIRVPLGASAGGPLVLAGGAAFIPSVRTGLSPRRTTSEESGDSVRETSNSVFAVVGGTLSLEDRFVRTEAGLDSDAAVDPFVSLRVGVCR